MSDVKPPPRWLVRLNVWMLRRGLRIGSQHVLSVRRRKTGEIRSTPISMATLDSIRYVVRFFGSADPNVVVAAADSYPVFRIESL